MAITKQAHAAFSVSPEITRVIIEDGHKMLKLLIDTRQWHRSAGKWVIHQASHQCDEARKEPPGLKNTRETVWFATHFLISFGIHITNFRITKEKKEP